MLFCKLLRLDQVCERGVLRSGSGVLRSEFFGGQDMITIKDMAEMLGISTSTVSNVIHGKTSEVSQKTVERVEKLLDKYSVNKVDALIQFVGQESEIDYLVFGVDTKEQLLQDIGVHRGKSIPKELIEELKEAFVDIEKSIIFPSLWSNGRKAE